MRWKQIYTQMLLKILELHNSHAIQIQNINELEFFLKSTL